jgi:hypothetical protein
MDFTLRDLLAISVRKESVLGKTNMKRKSDQNGLVAEDNGNRLLWMNGGGDKLALRGAPQVDVDRLFSKRVRSCRMFSMP